MPGTDDIAERVADLLLEESTKAGAYVVDHAPIVADGVVRGTGSAAKTVIDKVKDGTARTRLKKLEKDGAKLAVIQFWGIAKKLNLDTDTMKIADEDSKDFERLLRKQGMVFAAMDNSTDNYTVFLFLRKDSEKVNNAFRTLEAQRGKVTELKADMFMNAMEPDRLSVLENVDSVEAELFRYYAKEHGLVFTHLPGTDGNKGQILYLPTDAQKARQVLLSTGWALTGEGGARVREQVQHYLKGRNAITEAIEAGNKELYIVSGINPGHAVHISEEDFKLYKNGNFVKAVEREEADFYTKCMAACASIPNAVVLTKEEFDSPDITPDSIQHMPTMDLFPPDTVQVTEDGYVNNLYDGFDPIREQTRINELYRLVSMKMSLDNEGNASWGTFDPSVSFSEFAGYEHYQDSAEQEGREAEFEHFKKAAFYGQETFNPQEVDMQDKDIDFIISRAYTRAGIRPEPEQESPAHEPGTPDR